MINIASEPLSNTRYTHSQHSRNQVRRSLLNVLAGLLLMLVSPLIFSDRSGRWTPKAQGSAL